VTLDGEDAIAVRSKGFLALAFDHRIVDGADADRFMADVKLALETFPDTGA
jgi:2-oxoglutarate dehydrogenase E2 component (dihydrolipoamide succinyltransferase)